MSDPRFHRRTVRTRAAHACHWCPDEVPAGAEAAAWSCREVDGACHSRWAHPYCEDEAVAMIAEAMGDDDGAVLGPDPGCIPRMLGFFDTPDQLSYIVLRRVEEPAERERLHQMWLRVQPGGDLAELAGTVPRARPS